MSFLNNYPRYENYAKGSSFSLSIYLDMGTLASYVPLTWLTTNCESLFDINNLTPISFANFNPVIKALYLA